MPRADLRRGLGWALVGSLTIAAITAARECQRLRGLAKYHLR